MSAEPAIDQYMSRDMRVFNLRLEYTRRLIDRLCDSLYKDFGSEIFNEVASRIENNLDRLIADYCDLETGADYDDEPTITIAEAESVDRATVWRGSEFDEFVTIPHGSVPGNWPESPNVNEVKE